MLKNPSHKKSPWKVKTDKESPFLGPDDDETATEEKKDKEERHAKIDQLLINFPELKKRFEEGEDVKDEVNALFEKIYALSRWLEPTHAGYQAVFDLHNKCFPAFPADFGLRDRS